MLKQRITTSPSAKNSSQSKFFCYNEDHNMRIGAPKISKESKLFKMSLNDKSLEMKLISI